MLVFLPGELSDFTANDMGFRYHVRGVRSAIVIQSTGRSRTALPKCTLFCFIFKTPQESVTKSGMNSRFKRPRSHHSPIASSSPQALILNLGS